MSGHGLKRLRAREDGNPFLLHGRVNEAVVIEALDRLSNQLSQTGVTHSLSKGILGGIPDQILEAYYADGSRPRSPTRAIYLRAYQFYLNRDDEICKKEIQRIKGRWADKPKSGSDRQLDVIVFANLKMLDDYLSGRVPSFPINRQRWIDFAQKVNRDTARLPLTVQPAKAVPARKPTPVAPALKQAMPEAPWTQEQVLALRQKINKEPRTLGLSILDEISRAILSASDDRLSASLLYCYGKQCEFYNVEHLALAYFSNLASTLPGAGPITKGYAHYMSAVIYYKGYEKNNANNDTLDKAEAKIDLASDESASGVVSLRFLIKLAIKKPMEALNELRKLLKISTEPKVVTESKIKALSEQLMASGQPLDEVIKVSLVRFGLTEILANWQLKPASQLALPEEPDDELE